MRLFLFIALVAGFLIGGSLFPDLFILEIEGAWYVKLLLFIAFFVLIQLFKLIASIITVIVVPTEKGRITYSALFFTLVAGALTASGAVFETFNFSLGGILLVSFFFAILELIRDEKQQATS